ncbi:S-methyl-5-thioribose-1-phosphate isomerase [Bailinhaonella thermotolerans]|uniref:S-methyl-5-thioribose-1-phosphate isomerase n=1 Tax=Bailinhaonella thermotolerans TaxID=1070861 RepID=UPI00192A5B5E|nr:S-methyl-5-thioribose-1-phosphate isomerase [Bailinhaonella thermotolerans]
MDVIRWLDPPAVALLDQTRLPAEETEITCRTADELIGAIRRLAVRGAPLLGIAGAYGVALAARTEDDVPAAAKRLADARPTAVNLALGVRRALAAWERTGPAGALEAARALAREEAEASARMAAHGLAALPGGPLRLLTHCNTGALAAGGDGTALAVVLAAHRAGRLRHLWIDETRPLFQGARLTAWEAERAGLPYSVLPDSAAGSLFAAGLVDAVLVGADRVAADGSVANKVGTYPLAVLARHHGVPFIVVAPTTTVDPGTPTGAGIVIERRPAREVTHPGGTAVAPEGADAYNPAFDVTPPELVTAFVSERGITQPVSTGSLRRLPQTHHPDCENEGP